MLHQLLQLINLLQRIPRAEVVRLQLAQRRDQRMLFRLRRFVGRRGGEQVALGVLRGALLLQSDQLLLRAADDAVRRYSGTDHGSLTPRTFEFQPPHAVEPLHRHQQTRGWRWVRSDNTLRSFRRFRQAHRE